MHNHLLVEYFWGLRRHQWISPSDFSTARASCVEVTLDIDATLFREVQRRIPQDNNKKSTDSKDIDTMLFEMLGRFFTRIDEPTKVINTIHAELF